MTGLFYKHLLKTKDSYNRRMPGDQVNFGLLFNLIFGSVAII